MLLSSTLSLFPNQQKTQEKKDGHAERNKTEVLNKSGNE
jgi:hypothetical protein